MPLQAGDKVLLALSKHETVAGEIVSTDISGVFSDGWRIQAAITEAGHPKCGQLGLYHTGEIRLDNREGSV